MRTLYLALKRTKTRRSLLAALFLIVFLAETGSHAVICADHSSGDEQNAASSRDAGHEDPCQTLILCSDSKQKDQQLPKFGHDASQHNALFDANRNIVPQVGFQREPKIAFGTAHCLFRPTSPPFQPPKAS